MGVFADVGPLSCFISTHVSHIFGILVHERLTDYRVAAAHPIRLYIRSECESTVFYESGRSCTSQSSSLLSRTAPLVLILT